MESERTNVIFANMFLSKNKRILATAAALGMVLVMLSSLFSNIDKQQPKNESSGTELISEYCLQQEKRLENILSSIEGVGEAHVMLTLENGIEYRYAADEKLSDDSVFTYADGDSSPSKVQQSENSEQNYILIGSSGDKRPLVVTEISPKVKGVVVVCEGGANPITVKRVTDAVTTALGINSLQVCVSKASK